MTKNRKQTATRQDVQNDKNKKNLVNHNYSWLFKVIITKGKKVFLDWKIPKRGNVAFFLGLPKMENVAIFMGQIEYYIKNCLQYDYIKYPKFSFA